MPNYIEFDKSQSDLYPAASNTGLTVLGISASNEVFLKDSNGAITVIGNKAPLESILQTDNVANTNIEMRGASLVLDTVNSSLIVYEDSISNNTLTLSTENLTDGHNLKLPDGTGTLILTVNGQGPDSSGNINVATGSFTGSFSGSFYGQVVGSLSGTASFASNATNAVTASYVPLVAGPGINISGLNISASVRTVNAVLPVDGNIALSLSATKTGDSASLASFPTSSLADGTVWIVSGDANPDNNGDAYIFNSGSRLWYPIAPLDQAAADARYLLLNSTGSMLAPYALTSALGSYVQNSATSSFVLVSSFNAYTSSVVTTSSFNAFTSSALLTAFFSSWTGSFGSQFAGSASYASASTNAVSSSYALTASYALNAGNIDTGSLVTTSSFNSYTGSNTSQFAGTASFVAGTLFTGTNLAATSSLAVSASYVRILQGTNITVNYSADGIQISSSAAGGGGGAGVDNIGVANSTQIQLKSGSFFVGDAITVPFATSATSASYILGSNVVGTVASASLASTASLAPNYVLNSSTSSMLAPYVLSSDTSSFVTNSQTSSFVTNSQTSSFVTNSQTSSMTVGTASFAPNYVLNSATSSFVTNSQTSSMSVATASFVTASSVVGTVTSASYALTASFALNATPLTPTFIATGSVTASVSPTGSLTISSGSGNIRVTISAPSASINFFQQGSLDLRLGWEGSKGIAAYNINLEDYTTVTGKRGHFDTIQAGQGLAANQYSALNLIGRGFSGTANIASINLQNSFSSNPTRMIIYDNSSTGAPISILPTDGNLLVGTTVDTGHRLYVAGSGSSGSLNINNVLTVSGSSVVITGSLTVSGSSTFTNIGPAVFSGSVTIASGSILQGTASFAQALTNTGYLINTGSTDVLQTITGSLTVTQNVTILGSASIAYLTASQTLVNQNTITVFANGVGLPNASYIAADTSSVYPSSSLNYNIVNQKWFVDKPFSGSLEGVFTGTAVGYLPLSATSSMLSPYALTTALSSYVLNSTTSSMTAGTASFVTASSVRGPHGVSSVVTSSYALTASIAMNVVNVDTTALVSTSSFNQYTSSVGSQFAGTASFATTASFIINSQFLPIVIEAKIDSNAIPLTSSFTPSISVFGLRSGSTAVTSSNFVNRQVEVFRNGNLLPGINLGGGEDYITKAFGSNTITFINALDTDEYIKIKCL